MPKRCSQTEPLVRLNGILRDAVASVIHGGEESLRRRAILLSRFAKPPYRLEAALLDASAFIVHRPEHGLSLGMTLLGCLAKPFCRTTVGAPDALTLKVRNAEIALSGGKASVSQWSKQPNAHNVVAAFIRGNGGVEVIFPRRN
jgi:hypothetical protein